MAKKIKKENDTSLLALGEIQEEIEIKEKAKKKLVFPIMLMILGITLMLMGIFFNRIIDFLGINLNHIEKKEETVIKDDNILNCKSVAEDKTLGLTTTINYTYIFKNEKLVNVKETRTIEPIEYSDIGPTNIRVINGQYTDLIGQLVDINGLKINSNLNNNKLIVSIIIDLTEIDITKVPKNDKIEISNTLNETSKSVKQKLAHQGDILCK